MHEIALMHRAYDVYALPILPPATSKLHAMPCRGTFYHAAHRCILLALMAVCSGA